MTLRRAARSVLLVVVANIILVATTGGYTSDKWHL